jgi:hypothetical protein
MFWARDEFKTFVDDVKDQTLLEITQAAEQQHTQYLTPRSPYREQKAKYKALLSGFLDFLKAGVRPVDLGREDFQLFRPVVEALVQSGQFNPTALDLFE